MFLRFQKNLLKSCRSGMLDLKFVSVLCCQPHIIFILYSECYIPSFIYLSYMLPRRQTSPVNRPIIWAHPHPPPLTILILGGFSSQSLVTSNNRISNFKRTRSLKWMFLSKVWNIPNIQKSQIYNISGTVLLDFDADACQSPSRAYLLDVTLPGTHKTCFSSFSP